MPVFFTGFVEWYVLTSSEIVREIGDTVHEALAEKLGNQRLRAE